MQLDLIAIDRLPELEPGLREAIDILADTWEDVPTQAIQSYWQHADVIPLALEDDANGHDTSALQM